MTTNTTLQTISSSPVFQQSIDAGRPHTLLTKDVRVSGSLEYRYDDTGQRVSVPNIWYNQCYQTRVAAINSQADLCEGQAKQYLKSPPYQVSPDAAANIAQRYKERAARIRIEARRIEAASNRTKPVAASLLALDFGDNVFC
jgi:hypothetical protein